MADARDKSDIQRIQEENERLKATLVELKILNDIAVAISSAWSLDQIMELIVRKCIKHFRAEQGAVMLLDTVDEQKAFHTMIRRADTSSSMLPYRLDTQLRGWMLKYRKPLLSNDLQNDPRFRVNRGEEQPIRSVLSVPLRIKGKMIGSLNLFNKRTPEGFDDGDARFLSIIGAESAQVIESARLREEAEALSLMQKEMKLAYKIQTGLLPQAAPELAGYDVCGRSIPAKEVGGDYYDFVRMGEHRLGICVGDVSGKGMPAALLMANLQATLRGQILQDLSPKVCLERSNSRLLTSLDPGRFVTLFCATLDIKSNELAYSNAGHNYPFLFKAGGDIARLEGGGVALGCIENPCYTEDSITLVPGDMLVLYSDGITEAVNKELQQFGEESLIKVVMEGRSASAEQLAERVFEAVRLHSDEATPMDDMTAVVIKRESGT